MPAGLLVFGLFFGVPLAATIAATAWGRAWKGPLVLAWGGLAVAGASAIGLLDGRPRSLPDQWAVVCAVIGGGAGAWVGVILAFALGVLAGGKKPRRDAGSEGTSDPAKPPSPSPD